MITETQLRKWAAWSEYGGIPPDGAAVQKAIRIMTSEIRRLQRIETAARTLVLSRPALPGSEHSDEALNALDEALKDP